ncbi:hypothetical protein DITRI_Ditri03aG0097500 [Diplodiscus trichospermus]
MTLNRNSCSYLLITLWILLIIQSSRLISAKIIDYPSFANAPNSWRNTPSNDFSFWETAGVKPILVNGMFVCGFHCSLEGQSCLFSVFIFSTSSDGNNSCFSPQVVWSANRNNPVENQAQLQLTPEGGLVLKDGDGVVVWSANGVGKSISRLNLSAEGNLMLFDRTNNMIWQSFDYPTDSLVLGQRLASGQKLRANVSSFNSSEGLYVFAIIDDQLTAYMEVYPFQIYYSMEIGNISWPSYVEFQSGMFGGLPVPDSANFIRLGSDGHLRAYEWKESKWEGIDLFEISRCDYPLACGEYGLCVEEGCSCPEAATQSQTTYFRPINYTRPDLGCYAISPISCELSSHQSLLELQDIDYALYEFDIPFAGSGTNMSREDCKEACLNNCSCKAAVHIYSFGDSYCYLVSEVLSIKISDSSDNLSFFNISVSIKVQNFPSALNPNRYLLSAQSPNSTLPSADLSQGKRQDIAVILGSTLGVISGVFLICIFCFLLIKKGFKEVDEEDYLDNISGMPTRFSFEELKNVTRNFSNKLGEGGFGSVYRGTLPSGSEVAVKHLDGFGPVKKSFIAEVQTIGSIHHFNLVSLVGFCAEKYNRLLIYEYMCKGSLDQWIFHKNQELALGWQIRKKIITDIAKGLAYLHEECNQKIIHFDIKPQNILLDENFNAKVSDFGLSKLIGRDQSQVITTMRGTPGYMAPEWLSSFITEKVDVYSFGIVVLEILCGRKNMDPSQQEEDRHLLSVFRRKQEEGQLVDLVDKCSEDMQSNAAEVVEMMKVGAWCLQAEYGRRPSMSTVVKVLEGSFDFVGNLDDDFLNELTVGEAVQSFASTVLPSMLSGPR